MKYIIDIPNDSINKYVSLLDKESFVVPITVGSDSSLRFNTGLKLKPYTEPDHKAIEDEVWEFARGLLYYTDENWESLMDLLLVEKASYQEAKAKYEAWSKQNIREGDEVIYNSRTKAVVLIPETKERYGTILTSEFDTISVSHDDLEKTGKHFEDVSKLLKKIKENK